MNHFAVATVVLPALMGALLLILHAAPLTLQRTLSAASTLGVLAAALATLAQSASGEIGVYALGNWSAPFGIVLVADRLSSFMVVLTALLAAAVLLYAVHGWDARGRFFHPLLQFQLMGLNGAFLTGDLFNLFVFFEVMLIASYCLMLQGLGAARLRATLHYVAINLTASGVFLIAVSLLYGITGTLNMAHLAERIAQAPSADIALVRACGLLLLGVFSVKAAVFPLYFWLPAGYANAAAPVAALFAIMTKVGVYAIIRVSTLLFGGDTGAAVDLTSPWLLPLALITLTLASLGALGAERLATMVSYLTIASVGTMLCAVAIGGTAGLSAALYYLAHSTLVIAALFLLADLLGRQRGAMRDVLHTGPQVHRAALLGIVFMIGGATIAGLPPTSGFIGKIMVLHAVREASGAALTWAVVLVTSLIMVVACARAGSFMLWNVTAAPPLEPGEPPRCGEWTALGALVACGALLVVFAAPLKGYTDAAAAQLAAPAAYLDAVLGTQRAGLLRPTRGPEAR